MVEIEFSDRERASAKWKWSKKDNKKTKSNENRYVPWVDIEREWASEWVWMGLDGSMNGWVCVCVRLLCAQRLHQFIHYFSILLVLIRTYSLSFYFHYRPIPIPMRGHSATDFTFSLVPCRLLHLLDRDCCCCCWSSLFLIFFPTISLPLSHSFTLSFSRFRYSSWPVMPMEREEEEIHHFSLQLFLFKMCLHDDAFFHFVFLPQKPHRIISVEFGEIRSGNDR